MPSKDKLRRKVREKIWILIICRIKMMISRSKIRTLLTNILEALNRSLIKDKMFNILTALVLHAINRLRNDYSNACLLSSLS